MEGNEPEGFDRIFDHPSFRRAAPVGVEGVYGIRPSDAVFNMQVTKMDLRPGGTFLYGFGSTPAGDMWGKFVYREIVPPECLVFVVSFTDPDGNPVRHPLSPTWPLEVLNTMTLSEQDGKTTLTIRAVPINATEEERKTFEAGLKSMEHGFGGALDRLVEHLATE